MSGGIPKGFWRFEQDAADSQQEVFHWAPTGQVQFDTILVLHDPHGNFE